MISYRKTLNAWHYDRTYYVHTKDPPTITIYGIPLVEWTQLLKLPNAVDVYYDGYNTLYSVIAGKTNIPKIERRK